MIEAIKHVCRKTDMLDVEYEQIAVVTSKEVHDMANQEHLNLLREGVEVWNQWCGKNPTVQIDLSGVDLSGANLRTAYFYNANLSGTGLSNTDLRGANLAEANLRAADLRESMLSEADLSGANLRGANLHKANLGQASLNGTAFRGTNLNRAYFKGAFLVRAYFSEVDFGEADFSQANLSGAGLRNAYLSRVNLSGADLSRASLEGAILSKADLRRAFLNDANLRETHLQQANLSETNLQRANLSGADLSRADLSNADLLGANLQRANVSEANFTGANLSRCRVYAISAWNVRLEKTIQSSLIITSEKEPSITVDDLEVAQFVYLLLNNQKIRNVIDAVTSKVVLILGRFTPERKVALDAIRDELRKNNYSPVLFDFEKPANRDLTETVSTLAHLARFIIVDLTDPSSAPHEVATVIPQTVVPIQPLLWQEPLMVDGKVMERREYAMFEDLRRRYHWVLPTFRYQDTAELLASLQTQIIAPAEQKARELTQPK